MGKKSVTKPPVLSLWRKQWQYEGMGTAMSASYRQVEPHWDVVTLLKSSVNKTVITQSNNFVF